MRRKSSEKQDSGGGRPREAASFPPLERVSSTNCTTSQLADYTVSSTALAKRIARQCIVGASSTHSSRAHPSGLYESTKELKLRRPSCRSTTETVTVRVRDKTGDIQADHRRAASGVWLAYLGKRSWVASSYPVEFMHNVARASASSENLGAWAWHCGQTAETHWKSTPARKASNGSPGSYDDLKPAIALYKRSGYDGANDITTSDRITVFMREKIVG